MKKSLAAALALASTLAGTPADAAAQDYGAFKINCQGPNGGLRLLEAYTPEPGKISVWYNFNAHITMFEPLLRGSPIIDNVIVGRIIPLRMDTHFHTVNNRGYATMTRGDFDLVFGNNPANTYVPINGYKCQARPLGEHATIRLLPLDPRTVQP